MRPASQMRRACKYPFDMPPPPLNDKGRPKIPHSFQAKMTFIDLEFLGWEPNSNLITELSLWHAEELAPRTWRIKPMQLDLDRATDTPYAAKRVREAAAVNGYNAKDWADCPSWFDVREEIAHEVFKRCLVGANLRNADLMRLHHGFDPWGFGGWIYPDHIDLQQMARLCGHKRVKLDALCEAYEIPPEDIHHAEGGVRRVRAVCEAMLGVRDGGSDRVDGRDGDSAPVQRGRTAEGVRDGDA